MLRLGDLATDRAGTGTAPAQVHDRQHYRLIGWRNGICGYRRFFSITSLAGLRQEDRAVFDATHVGGQTLVRRGPRRRGAHRPSGRIVRPRRLSRLAARARRTAGVDRRREDPRRRRSAGPHAAGRRHHRLRRAARDRRRVHRPRGRRPADRPVRLRRRRRTPTMPALARELKAEAVTDTLGSELARLCRTITAATGADHPGLPDAVAALSATSACTASDYQALSAVLPVAFADTAAERPGTGCAAGDRRRRRWPSAPRPTSGCSSCAARRRRSPWRTACSTATPRLVSLNEVGGEPRRFGVSAAEFHQRAAVRAELWPHAMIALTHPRHQARRGCPRPHRRAVAGAVAVGRARRQMGAGRPAARRRRPDCSCCRTSSGCGRPTASIDDELRERLHAYAEKAIREAAAAHLVERPDAEFESAVHAWLDAVLDGPVAAELTSLVARLDAARPQRLRSARS